MNLRNKWGLTRSSLESQEKPFDISPLYESLTYLWTFIRSRNNSLLSLDALYQSLADTRVRILVLAQTCPRLGLYSCPSPKFWLFHCPNPCPRLKKYSVMNTSSCPNSCPCPLDSDVFIHLSWYAFQTSEKTCSDLKWIVLTGRQLSLFLKLLYGGTIK